MAVETRFWRYVAEKWYSRPKRLNPLNFIMKLLPRQRDILAAIEHRASNPLATIRKLTGCRDHTIQYEIAKLTENGTIVGRSPFINFYPLGFTDFTLFFSIAAEKARVRDSLLSHLLSEPTIQWVGSLGGDFQFGAAVCAKRAEDALLLFQNIFNKFENVFFEKSFVVRVNFIAFGRKYLSSRKITPVVLKNCWTGQSYKTDATDHKILSVMSQNSYSSYRDLARQCGIPPSTVERRIRALKEADVLGGEIYRYNLSRFGAHTYRILLYARGVNQKLSKDLFLFAKKHSRVIHFIECLGSWDYELGVEVDHPLDVTEIVQQVSALFGPYLNGVKLLQIFRHLKFTSYPFPLDG